MWLQALPLGGFGWVAVAVCAVAACAAAQDKPKEVMPSVAIRLETPDKAKSGNQQVKNVEIVFAASATKKELRRVTIRNGSCAVVASGQEAKNAYGLQPPKDAVHYVECNCTDGIGEWHLAMRPQKGEIELLARYVEEGGGLFVSKWTTLEGNELDACNAMIDGRPVE